MARKVQEHAPRIFFLCDRNLVSFGDVFYTIVRRRVLLYSYFVDIIVDIIVS